MAKKPNWGAVERKVWPVWDKINRRVVQVTAFRQVVPTQRKAAAK